MFFNEYDDDRGRTRVELPAAGRHVDQSLPIEWYSIVVGGECVVVHDAGQGSVSAYTINGVTRNVRVLPQADAVLWDGAVMRPRYNDEYRAVELSHIHAGIQHRMNVGERLDGGVPLLNTTEMVSLGAE
jgi:hypothetical protein